MSLGFPEYDPRTWGDPTLGILGWLDDELWGGAPAGSVFPPTGQLLLTGFPPTVITPVPTGQLILTGFPPTVIAPITPHIGPVQLTDGILYLCEAAGSRIIAFGRGIVQVGSLFQASVQTWDALPTGDLGVSLFRSINVAINAVGAWTIGITPTVDGIDFPEQVFSGATGDIVCEALIGLRGTRVAATVRTIVISGDFEIQNVSYSALPIRDFP